MKIKADCYQQFDADYSLEVPAEGYGGWKQIDIDLSPEHTALVVMHAWDTGAREKFPGWYRAVEYLPRAGKICAEVFPPLLAAVRNSELSLFHVTGGGEYGRRYPGYERAVQLAGPTPGIERIEDDTSVKELRKIKSAHSFVGSQNQADVAAGFKNIDFAPEACPQGDEGVAENAHQLFALCKDAGVNHLIYVGFAINWCLLMSPGGMLDMCRRGLLCSTIRQAVTAVENKESARTEMCKELALWRVALGFGFVFDLNTVLAALGNNIN
ncbi:MAG: hypothetical protein PHV82_18905 [Victivallaceae bacterium]|nr:hypothetical protein [Victivallaceae bacterium]